MENSSKPFVIPALELIAFAQTIRLYYENLLKIGFTQVQAMKLTLDFQHTMLSLNNTGGK